LLIIAITQMQPRRSEALVHMFLCAVWSAVLLQISPDENRALRKFALWQNISHNSWPRTASSEIKTADTSHVDLLSPHDTTFIS